MRSHNCRDERRREFLRDQTLLNGLDYIEVSPNRRSIAVHFIHPLPGQEGGVPSDLGPLNETNVIIEGGVRIRNLIIMPPVKISDSDKRVLILNIDSPGDFSTYKLRLIKSPNDRRPIEGFDPRLSEMAFSFDVQYPLEVDCRRESPRWPKKAENPQIDYMAKDYASFRHLILDRLAETIPEWREKNPSDLGIALVELMAYAGDYLSYYQDAVATEAYLGTARRRTSVRRHVRLLDYRLHDGCNSRAWVHFEVEGGDVNLRRGDKVLTWCIDKTVLDSDSWSSDTAGHRPEIFELMHDATLYPEQNIISFYTWGEEIFHLPKGATRATLKDTSEVGRGRGLNLRKGDVLIIEEIIGPRTGDEGGADPSHRHPVRLKEIIKSSDPITGQAVLEVEWHARDALPFPLQISDRIKGFLYSDMSCARGNVVLADHGLTVSDQAMLPSEAPKREYRPKLLHSNLTFSAPYYHSSEIDQPASGATIQESYLARPALHLEGDGELWTAERDLLRSDRFSSHFVVETEDDTSAYLRFGDGIQGRRPTPGAILKASYRIGNGTSGNVGADSIAHLVMTDEGLSGNERVTSVRNPLPAQGGTDPEPTYQARLHAPYIFHRHHRAVTEGDYAEMAERHPDVDRAVAFLRWTGSWHTMYIVVDRKGRRPINDDFKRDLSAFMERFRQAGCDIEIRPPRFIPLTIAFTVSVKPGYQAGYVKQELLRVFSSSDLMDGRRGFFHPANFSFGQPVYLSDIISVAMEVHGVAFVDASIREPHRFCPLAWASLQATREMIGRGMIAPDPLDILQLDNDPNAPENGTIEFIMQGAS